MGAFNSRSDPEQEYRRQLLAAVRKGKVMAKEELEREYHVRTYSAAEREKLYYTATAISKTNKSSYEKNSVLKIPLITHSTSLLFLTSEGFKPMAFGNGSYKGSEGEA